MQPSLAWWVGFHAGVFTLLAADWLTRGGGVRAPTMRAALGWSVGWIALAAAFGGAIGLGWVGGYAGAARPRACLDFFTAFFLEKSLSLDNLFVFALLFRNFAVPPARQREALAWGVLGAMALRLGMVLGGVALLERFEWMTYLFGAFILWSAWRMWRGRAGGEGREMAPPWLRRQFSADRVAPFFALLIVIELSDAVFALDSVPAVLSVTRDPFLAYTSNVFAVLGLRSLYFLLAGLLDRCRLLHHGLALLLALTGLKMLLAQVYSPGAGVSLLVIAAIVIGSVAGSWLIKPVSQTAK